MEMRVVFSGHISGHISGDISGLRPVTGLSIVGNAGSRARRSLCAWLAGLLLGFLGISAGPVLAHHSVSMFDSSKEVVLEGTITRMEWANPHVWIRLNVADENGEMVEWGVEASNPLDLGRKGWTKNTFRQGDEVTITIYPARNGRPFGSFVRATLADGTVLDESQGGEQGEQQGEKKESPDAGER